MNRELITPQADLEPITIQEMIALAPSIFTASVRSLRIEAKRVIKKRQYASAKPANATPPRTHVNTATAGVYAGTAMACTRPAAGQRSPNGRAA